VTEVTYGGQASEIGNVPVSAKTLSAKTLSAVPERVGQLAFSSPTKRMRYDTSRFRGATGRNWYDSDPTLQFLMAMHLGPSELAWATPHLRRVGALMGGPVSEYADQTDRMPARLERYDRWGHETAEVILPESFVASQSAVLADNLSSPSFADQARRAGVNPAPLSAAWSYLLDQADIGMTCALGTGGDMVIRMAESFAPPDVLARVRELFAGGDNSGAAGQMFTERAGGSDLGALETTATHVSGDTWRLDGVKWFVSNVHAPAFVALAKIEGGVDGVKGVMPFLVLSERRDGGRNGIRIRRLKDKLGTKSVPSGEVELDGAEAFLLAPPPGDTLAGSAESGVSGRGGAGRGSSGLAAMMRLTNGARLGIAMMGVGCARRALVESVCYTQAREAFGARLIDQPLVKRKLAEMIVEVEAAQAVVFDGYLGNRLRLSAPLAKLRAARLGLTAASDAVELHGGNGYIETWPVARILRDAQVNTVWEGADNILCLDVRRAMEREQAHEALFERVAASVAAAPDVTADQRAAKELTAAGLERARRALACWRSLEADVAEARLFPLSQLFSSLYTSTALLDQVAAEQRGVCGDAASGRKALVAAIHARRYLAASDPLAEIEGDTADLDRFKLLLDGAFVDV